jgi:hypothetical protein
MRSTFVLFGLGVNGVFKRPKKQGFLAIVPEAVASPRSGVRMGSDVQSLFITKGQAATSKGPDCLMLVDR